MKRKLFNALLFGALVASSTSTFVSCKDYDDDIQSLQAQIDANKKSIESIEALIKSGSVITNVEQSTNGVKVTLSDGKTFNLTNGVMARTAKMVRMAPLVPHGLLALMAIGTKMAQRLITMHLAPKVTKVTKAIRETKVTRVMQAKMELQHRENIMSSTQRLLCSISMRMVFSLRQELLI